MGSSRAGGRAPPEKNEAARSANRNGFDNKLQHHENYQQSAIFATAGLGMREVLA